MVERCSLRTCLGERRRERERGRDGVMRYALLTYVGKRERLFHLGQLDRFLSALHKKS